MVDEFTASPLKALGRLNWNIASYPACSFRPVPDPVPFIDTDALTYSKARLVRRYGGVQGSAGGVSAKAAYAHDRGITGEGATIAVLDTGISRTAPKFAG